MASKHGVSSLLSLLVVTCLVLLYSNHCSLGLFYTYSENSDAAFLAPPEQPLCKKCQQFDHRQPPPTPSILDASRLNNVRMAGMVDITYAKLPADRSVHPYRGARTEDGTFGYIADEKFLHHREPQQTAAFVMTQNEIDKACSERDGNYKMLTEKVKLANRTQDEGAAASSALSPKILCVLFVVEQDHDKLESIHNTWGSKCDGMIIGSNRTDRRIGAVDIPHEGPEVYNNIWQKVRSLWFYVYDNYYEDYDYFHSGGSDLYLLVDNLREYLVSREIRAASNGGRDPPPADNDEHGEPSPTYQTPLYLGRRFALMGNRDDIFVGGSGGYTINKAALKQFILMLPYCEPHGETFSEDLMMARCLKQLGIFPYDTKDVNGGERYHPFRPADHLTVYNDTDIAKGDDWYLKYCIDCKWGIDHASSQSVAFHGVYPELMNRMHAILYGYCDK